MKQIRKGYLTVILLAVILMMNGCRPSPALVEEVYTPAAQKTELNPLEMEENSIGNPLSSELPPKAEIPESDDKRNRVRDLPVEDEKGSDALPPAEHRKTQENTVADTAVNKPAKARKTVPEKNQVQEALAEVPDTVSQEVFKKTLDADGTFVEVPKEVNTAAAVGEAAVMVRMLGGAGRLLAVSEDYASNRFVQSAFPEKDGPAPLWKGNGSSGISSGNFELLLKKAPQVCFEFSGEATFSEEQYARLSAADIACVPLPRLNTVDNIRKAVRIVGEVLGDQTGKGGTDAPERAKKYTAYMASIIDETGRRVKRATSNRVDYGNDKTVNGTRYLSSGGNDTMDPAFEGKYSIFVSYWDDAASYKIYNSVNVYLQGEGAAVTKSGYTSSPVSYYMSIAGIINIPAMFPDFGVTQNWYVNPMLPSTKSISVTGNYKLPPDYYLTLTDNDISNNTEARTNGLGSDDKYPAVIVESQSIKEKLQNNSLWKFYGYVHATNGNAQNFGFLDDDGSIIESTIIDPYDIYVNPSGIGSWSEGSVESILEPVWLAYKFYSAFTEEEVKESIKDFYHEFYGYQLSNKEIKDILAGRK